MQTTQVLLSLCSCMKATRRIVAWIGAIAVGLPALAAPAHAQAKHVFNFNIFGPKRAVTAGIEAMADFFAKEGGGQVEIRIAYGSALGPEKQTPEAIRAGGYEGGQMCTGYAPNKFPLTNVMELPFLPPRKLEDRIKVDEAVYAHPLSVKEMADRWGIMYFGPTALPSYEFMGNRRIAKPEDFNGVKVRISGLNAKALQKFGAVPVVVTAPEAYTALERGTIDSFGFPYAYSFGAYKLHEVSKYVTEGIALNGFMCFQGISIKAWSTVPESIRAKLPQAREAANVALLKAYAAADAKWIPIFHEKLEVDTFTPEMRNKLVAGASELWEDWVKEQEAAGQKGREMLDFVKAEVAKHKN
ncbi:MAG: TRAP transporter substrate-binding protein DctP [Hyphomicrobiaceae bacterium]